MLVIMGILLFVNVVYLLYGLCFLSRLTLLKGALSYNSGNLLGPSKGLVKRIFSALWLPIKLVVTLLVWPLFIGQYKRIYKTLRMQLIR